MTPLLRGKNFRPAWAEVDLGAIRSNLRFVQASVGDAEVCAVVKADGYGHGAVPVARAALDAGASMLAVALVEEGAVLRDASIDAPVLLLSEPPLDSFMAVVEQGLTPTLYSDAGVEAARRAAGRAGRVLGVEVKVDTGMHRVGAAFDSAVDIVTRISEDPVLNLDGVWTHLAVADEPEKAVTTKAQLDLFDRFCERVEASGVRVPRRHAANSAGALFVKAHYDVVRAGIALYGYSPNPPLAFRDDLLPALSLKARVAFVKRLAAGERVSYGHRYEINARSNVATVPLGYADGVPRRLSELGGQVLVRGERRPIAGTVTMDQILVDCGEHEVEVGDEVVFIGSQGDASITADEWAEMLGTISYEVVCGIGPRVPRVYNE